MSVWLEIEMMWTRYNFMWWSLSVSCDRSVLFSGTPVAVFQTTTIYLKYCWEWWYPKSTNASELDFRLRLNIGYPVEAPWFLCSKRLLSRLSVQSFEYDEGDSIINVFINDKQSLRTRTLFSHKSFDHTSVYVFWF